MNDRAATDGLQLTGAELTAAQLTGAEAPAPPSGPPAETSEVIAARVSYAGLGEVRPNELAPNGPVLYSGLPVALPVIRIPNLGDAGMFLLLLLLGLLAATGAVGLVLHYHWFGLRSFAQAHNSTRVSLSTLALIYGLGLAGAIPLFHMAWGKGLLTGLHWHVETAYRLRWRLVGTALVCNMLAIVGNWVLPFPQHAPIDKMFASSADAWLLMSFGITVAPFFEEMIFRGFLLPAIATAWDWCREQMTGRRPHPLDAQQNPVWSPGAMIFAALTVSAPFALMHSDQVGQAWGPLLLLYCVSLILCTVRLATRSLAASMLVHSVYNLMLFGVMLLETDGFQHLDKM
jgi:uncharacterized protein